MTTMPTHAELAAQLLRDAAGFFRSLAGQNDELGPQMLENADVFEQVAGLVETDPLSRLPEEK